MTRTVVAVIAGAVSVAIAGRAMVAVLDRRWGEVLCEVAGVALLILVVTGQVPLVAPGAPDPRFVDDASPVLVLR